ncbi:MAG: flagellar biosynthesis protein FlgJ [Proteobacteria bacterium]|nr:flagellar biosynthesis protein FlgJ [Pseudomonadota bacterium]
MTNRIDASAQAVFDALGISTQANPAERATKSELGQQDFLKLMTAQLQNQDPFSPMENGDFIAQMAQFSTVSGIEQMNRGLTGLADQMRQMRIATASNLLGHSVLVPGNLARPDADGDIHGVIDLPQASSSTRVNFSDAETGELYHSQSLGAQRAGLIGFHWQDLPPAVLEGRRQIKIEAMVNMGDGEQSLGPSVYAKVLAAAAGSDSTNSVMLDVQDYGEVAVTDTTRFR